MADDQGRVIYWNPMALAINGFASMDDCRRPLAEFAEVFEFRPFNQDSLLPVEEWPLCEALIAFFSTGFPLHKAQGYAQLHPSIVVFNDLKEQEVLSKKAVALVSGDVDPYHVEAGALEHDEGVGQRLKGRHHLALAQDVGVDRRRVALEPHQERA
jgi:hypothetical protein